MKKMYKSDNSTNDGIDISSNYPPNQTKTVSMPGTFYKCPRCSGEFSSWNRKRYVEDDSGQRDFVSDNDLSVYQQPRQYAYFCPFCDLEKGEYDDYE